MTFSVRHDTPFESIYRVLTGWALDLPDNAHLSDLTEAQLEDLAVKLTGLATHATRIQLRMKSEREAAREAARKGRNGIRLVADDGQLILTPRELAAQRRRKPRHVMEAS